MKKQLIIMVGALAGAVLLFFLTRPATPTSEFIVSEAVPETTERPYLEAPATLVVVDVKGSVQNPGIYELEAGARVHDAIVLAGGLTEEAAAQWVNLAERLSDEMVVFVPSIHDEELVMPMTGQRNDSGKININRATAGELTQLPGIGATRAEAIVRYREEQGAFASIEDLQNVSGIGAATFENLRELITH